MIIGFDLDDVLLNFSDSLIVHYNEKYGTNHQREDKKSYLLEELWNCTREEAVQRIDDFFHHTDHHRALPVPGAVEGIQKLKEHHSFSIITAKPENLRAKTLEWLDQYFPNTFETVCFTRQFGAGIERRPKSEVCRELGIEIFVDDALENAHDIAALDIPVLLFDTPWNQEEVQPPITRVFSWDEIVKKINN